MIETIVFDIDDTMYDQQQPFNNTVTRVLPFIKQHDFLSFYIQFRFHSDDTFLQAMTNRQMLEKMRVHRVNEALKDLGYDVVSFKKGLEFQQIYEEELRAITLHPEIKKMFDYLYAKEIPMGVITNGPSDHQYKKIKQLSVEQWIPADKIVISQSTGFHKPEKEIFQLAAKQFNMNPETTLYVGDNFENDVLGATNSGWQALWFNHRLRKIDESQKKPYLEEIKTFDSLSAYIQTIF